MILDPELIKIILPALFIGITIAISHALLGIEVLKRSIVFIDLAIAQIATIAVVITDIYFHNWLISQIIIILFALTAALFFYISEKKFPEIQEAIIGSAYIVAAAIVMLILNNKASMHEEVKSLFSGQILLNTWSDYLKHLPIYIIVICSWFYFPQVRKSYFFYLIFAILVTSSVQLIGINLVFASLIFPAIVSFKRKNANLIAVSSGITSIILGISLSLIFDLATSDIIIISYLFITLISALLLKYYKIFYK